MKVANLGDVFFWMSFYSQWYKQYTATAKSLQLCPTLCDPIDSSHQASLSLGFSRQEYWSRLPFPSLMHEKWKVKSESEVAQSCPTLGDPMDCSLPGSSIHGIFQAKYWSGVPLPSPINSIEPMKSIQKVLSIKSKEVIRQFCQLLGNYFTFSLLGSMLLPRIYWRISEFLCHT